MADNQISQPSFGDITVCASGSEGMGHFVFDIVRTQQLNPPKQYVPWVLFNGVSELVHSIAAIREYISIPFDPRSTTRHFTTSPRKT